MVAVAHTATRTHDLLALTKPRITRMVVFTAAVGMWMAPRDGLALGRVLWALIGTILIVSAANVLNMYLERDVDALMARTANRPLPAGRLSPSTALWFGVALASVAVPILTYGVDPLPPCSA